MFHGVDRHQQMNTVSELGRGVRGRRDRSLSQLLGLINGIQVYSCRRVVPHKRCMLWAGAGVILTMALCIRAEI